MPFAAKMDGSREIVVLNEVRLGNKYYITYMWNL